MKCLLFVILAGCAVKCDDNNYYVIEMPEDRLEDQERPFSVFWNVPTMQCKSKKIPFENLYEKYGILQNTNDSFRGEEISILYDPGLFPALLKNETSGKFKFRNGGVPQEGNLELHLETFKSVLQQSIPDANFHGVAIIDFESWRPIFRQNFGVLVPYKDISIEIEKKMHWWWPKQWIQAEAKQRFEEAARTFMQNTLSIAKQMRPNALWGYYGFPYCFNMANNKMKESCADKVPEENDRTYWLWSESTALYPSVYSSKDLTSSQLAGLIRGRVKEAVRVRRNSTPVLPYFWFRYREGGYLTEEDLTTALETLYKSNVSGFIIWGSSNDVNTVSKCKKLRQYIENTFGPAIAAYTKPITKLKDEIPQIPVERTTTKKPEIETNNKNPEFDWEPPENYAQDIKNYVEEEIKRKGSHFDKINETIANVNDSALMEIILNSLMEEHTLKNNNKDLPFVDFTTDSYKQSYNRDTSQSVDVNTSKVKSNIVYDKEALPTNLLYNSQTESIISSPENLVTKLLHSNKNSQVIGSTKISTEFPLNLEASQIPSTDVFIPKLERSHEMTITDTSNSEPIDSIEFVDGSKSLSTEFVTQQDGLKSTKLMSKPSSTEFSPQDNKQATRSISTELSTSDLQPSTSPFLSTEISTHSVNNLKKYSEEYNSHSTEDLVAKFITSTEISTTEFIHNSEEFPRNIFSGEYLITKLFQNNHNAKLDSTTESMYDIFQEKQKQMSTFTTDYLDENQKGMPETTTVGNLKTSDAIEKAEAENMVQYSQTQIDKLDSISRKATDNVTPSVNDNYTTDINSGSENNSTIEQYTENIQFFNQDTFLDNPVTPEEAINIFNNSSFSPFEGKNEAAGNILNDFTNSEEEADSTVTPTTELDQVPGAGSRVSVAFRNYLCVFYFYSVVKCLCAVFGMC